MVRVSLSRIGKFIRFPAMLMKIYNLRKLCFNHFASLNLVEKVLCVHVALMFLHFLTTIRFSSPNYIKLEDIPYQLDSCGALSLSAGSNRLPDCPLFPPELDEKFTIEDEPDDEVLAHISRQYGIDEGGNRTPHNCQPKSRVAILVPYRNRPRQLQRFLQYMHIFLHLQPISYKIFVVEQNSAHPFNRGKLFNIGFKEVLKNESFCCFIFHDVDLLPLNQKNLYTCTTQPRHMCASLDKFRHVLPYPQMFGGATALTKYQFEKVNGFGNMFFGWGGEDDDMGERIIKAGFKVVRFEPKLSRYTMLLHERQPENFERFDLIKDADKLRLSDGLNNVNYKVIEISRKALYTNILVDVNP